MWQVLFQVPRDAGIYFKEKRLIGKLDEDKKAILRCGEHEEAYIRKEIRQGCDLFPPSIGSYYLHTERTG